MNKLLASVVATTAVGFAFAGYAVEATSEIKSSVEHKKNGGYESSSESETVSPNGTKKTSETSVDLEVDGDGRISKTIESETKVDPKGLLNSKKDKVITKTEEKARGGYKKNVTHEHKDSDGTNVTTEVETKVDVDAKGNVIENEKEEKIVDPKGLMNSTTTTTTTKKINGDVVEHEKKAD